MKKALIINLLLIFFFGNAQSQNSKGNFNVQVREEIGDLNSDGLTDKVIITMIRELTFGVAR